MINRETMIKSTNLLLCLLALISSSRQVGAFSTTSPSSKKVTVVGGTGFVGSRVCKILTDKYGAAVTSISKNGQVPEWCKDEAWTSQVEWKSVDLLNCSDESLDEAMGKPSAVVSCVGVVGTDQEELLRGNGKANAEAFASAKRVGSMERAAFVSVASEVAACKDSWLPEFFSGYFEGKIQAEQAALSAVDDDSSKLGIVKPTFIYGGDSFGLLPPRVNNEYGSAVEEILTWGIFNLLADVTPGLIKVALRPPVSVDAVAGACASVAMGETSGILDGTEAIKAVTNDPAATGFSEALDWAKENSIKAYDWAKVEVPKAIEVVKKKIDETKKD